MFRLLPKYKVSNLHAIIVNYFTCFIVGSLVAGESPLSLDMVSSSWFPYALFLSLCFIFFFNVTAYTVQKVGIVVTGIFQKLSLVVPVILGLLVFQETSSTTKIIGILLTLIAIVLINIRLETEADENFKRYWYWPLLVFFGSGLIEAILFYTQETGKVVDTGVQFVTTLFLMAGCWGLIYSLVTNQFRFSKREVIFGILIGVPNFFTIYLIIRGLELGWDGSVLFPLNNVGVILVTALIGIFYFRERMNLINYIGLAVSLVAILLISM